MNYKEIKTSPEMDKSCKENLKLRGDAISLYALKLIEELEIKLNKNIVKQIKSLKEKKGGR